MLNLQATGPKDIWRTLKRTTLAHVKAIPDINGQAEFPAKCAALRQALFSPPAAGEDIPDIRQPADDPRDDYSDITCADIAAAIPRCNKQSACGYDKVPYMVIEKAHKHLHSLLTDLFTASVRVGFFPSG